MKTANFEDFIKEAEENYQEEEINQIKKAYFFACQKHEGKKRLDGSDYITHPLGVCEILLNYNVDAVTLEAGFIHETINHADATIEEITELFGSEVANIVFVISKINRLELNDDSEYSILNLRKILVGMSEDVRILFLKMADRIHNLRTGAALEKEALKRKVHETMTVLIPIAHRLGLYEMKAEMEDWCLFYSKPDVYQDILDRLQLTTGKLEESLEEMEEELQEILTEHNISFKMKSRVKSVYSIYNKLNNGKKWENIYDILALRVIVDTVSECYLTIGLIHAKFRPIPGRFKDYIAMPKQNMYQSLHTGVFGPDGQRYEIQVRTKEMDEVAEKGVAAHFAYKDKETDKHFIHNIMEQRLENFRNLIESSDSLSDIEFQNSIQNDLLEESIYVFTPKGDVVELPSGSTPIDYAYRIHTDIGDHTVGALVNDTIVPLNYELQNNDIVKIKTNASSTPNKEWMQFVKTGHARSKIKSYFSRQEKDVILEKGKTILQNELKKKKLTFDEIFTDEHKKKILEDLKMTTMEDVYFSIGTLRYTPTYIIDLATEDKKSLQDVLLEKVSRMPKTNLKRKDAILVGGKTGIMTTLSKCCEPVYGDEIVGFVTKGEGISIHKKGCPNVSQNKKRYVSVSWNENGEYDYFTTIYVKTDKNKNYLLDIVAKLTGKNVFLDSVKTKETDYETIYELLLKTNSILELNDFMNSLENYSFVKKVERK